MRKARNNPEKSNVVLITDDRIASLDALGFDWTAGRGEKAAKKSFERQRIEDLRAYKEKHGHIRVKQSEDKSLHKFCSKMRHARTIPEKSNRTLTGERIASLDALGFDWAVKEQAATKSFEQRIEDLQAYKEKNGHANVKKSEDKSLYGFCQHMRQARNNPRKSKNMLIDEERIASLDALGFTWSAGREEKAATKSFAQRLEDLQGRTGM